MTYCFRCKSCGAQFTLSVPEAGETTCSKCGECCIIRDYRAEGVGIGQGVRESRNGDKGRSDTHAFSQWAEVAADAEGI